MENRYSFTFRIILLELHPFHSPDPSLIPSYCHWQGLPLHRGTTQHTIHPHQRRARLAYMSFVPPCVVYQNKCGSCFLPSIPPLSQHPVISRNNCHCTLKFFSGNYAGYITTDKAFQRYLCF